MFGSFVGHNITVKGFQKKIVEKGYGEYFINEKTQVEWRWKE
jgi:hypothetical protein